MPSSEGWPVIGEVATGTRRAGYSHSIVAGGFDEMS
jgi:hypothetical protein